MAARIFAFPVFAVAVAMIAGCGRTEQAEMEDGAAERTNHVAQAHDHHDTPLTAEEIASLKEETAQYQDAVQRIRQYQQTVQQETTAGEPAKAHRALDNLDIVLERLPAAARDSGVAKGKWQEVNETAQKLRELFNQIHANIDAGTDPDYGAVADAIDHSIETLATIEPEKTE